MSQINACNLHQSEYIINEVLPNLIFHSSELEDLFLNAYAN